MRLISGQYKGRILEVPKEGTRPTSDRAKEMLFDILSAQLMKDQRQWSRIRFADVFSGSGAIGLEAISRGAKNVWVFENNKEAQRIIKKNAKNMSFSLLDDALNPPIINKAMDILFMDPPYGKGLWEKALPLFKTNGWIDKTTKIIIEVDKSDPLNIPNEFLLREKRNQGKNTFLFLETRED